MTHYQEATGTLKWVLVGGLAVGCFACSRPAERICALSTDASSRAGLVSSPLGPVAANEGGAVMLVGANGRPLWSASLGREIAARPALAGKRLVVGTVDGEWVAFDLETGNELWRRIGLARSTRPFATDGRSVFAVDPRGEVWAVDASLGSLAWRRPPGPVPKAGAAPAHSSAPVVLEDRLVVALPDGKVWAMNLADGSSAWSSPTDSWLGVDAMGSLVFGSTAGGKVVAFEGSDGRVAWSRDLSSASASAPSVAGGRVWVARAGSEVSVLNASTGAEEVRIQLPAPLTTQVAEMGELVLVPTNDPKGRLLAFGPPSPRPLFEVRADSPLRSRPVVAQGAFFVLGADGRVLGWKPRGSPTPSDRRSK